MTKQNLEIRNADNANAITTVEKDSMIFEQTYPLNTMPDGVCRTIKEQYYKNSPANFVRDGTWGATGGIRKEMSENQAEYRIRKLTPMECWRLMGFTDENFMSAKLGSKNKAKEVMNKYPNGGIEMMREADSIKEVSNTQLYKQAGNSIVVDVLYYIYKELYKAMPYLFENLKVGSYFSGIGAFEAGLDRLYDEIG